MPTSPPNSFIKPLLPLLPWALALIVLAIFLSLLSLQLRHQERAWQRELVRNYQDWVSAMGENHARYQLDAGLLGAVVAADPEVLRLTAEALAIRQEDAAADLHEQRDLLAGRLALYWQVFKPAGLTHLTLYLAPSGEVLYRAHQPERFGDTAGDHSQPVKDGLAKNPPSTTLVMGRYGPYLGSISPLVASDTGPAVGLLELGISLAGPVRGSTPAQGSAVLLNPRMAKNWLWPKAYESLWLPASAPRHQWILKNVDDDLPKAWSGAGLLPDPEMGAGYHLLAWEGAYYQVFTYLLSPEIRAEFIPVPPLALLGWRDISTELITHRTLMNQTRWRGGVAIVITLIALWLMLAVSRRLYLRRRDQQQQRLEGELALVQAEREELIRAMDSGDSGYWSWNLVTGVISMSPKWKSICGITEGARLMPDAEEWQARIHPHDKLSVEKELLRQIKGETERFDKEYRLRAEDGSYRWVHARGRVAERDARGRALRMLGVYADISRQKETELTLLRQQAALRALNEITALPALEPEEQLRRALALAAAYLAMPIAIVSEVRGDEYRIKVQVAPTDAGLKDGDCFTLRDTYCSMTLDRGGILAIDAMGESSYAQHPCYQRFRLESYIAVPLVVDGITYGTLSFSAREPRFHPFDQLDRDFVSLLGRWVCATLGRMQVLEAQQRLVRLSSTLQQAMLDTVGVAVIATDVDGVIRLFNKGAEIMLGFAAVDMVGRASLDVLYLPEEVKRRCVQGEQVQGEKPARAFDTFVAAASNDMTTDGRIWTYVCKDGRHLLVLLTVTAMRDSTGLVTGYLGMAQDIGHVNLGVNNSIIRGG